TCGTDTLSLSGTDAASFQISGTSLETSGTVVAGSYSINIVATISGATGSPYTQPETITGTSFTVQNPGPSAALFASPYYTCTTNYYVSQSGNDLTGNGSSGTPWATMQKAANTISSPAPATCVNVVASATAYNG